MLDSTTMSRISYTADDVAVSISDSDKQILRCLAERVALNAGKSIQEEKRLAWYKLNSLKSTSPVIFCDPENGWNEIITQDQLECTGSLMRRWEMTLRKDIFWAESMGDDKVVDLDFNIPYSCDITNWGLEEKRVGGEHGGAYHWEAPLKDFEADLQKLKFPQINVDYEATDKAVSIAQDIFSDILNVRLKGLWWWTMGLTMTATALRGLEQLMWDMYDYPEQLHQLMAFLRDGHMAMIDWIEERKLISLNNNNTYVGSGGFGFSDELPQKDFDKEKITTMDLWGFAESQETVSVSPDMFEEFIFPYQLPLMERFGLNCYGCCEPLDQRWNVVKKAPRLRRVSVSPWADLEKMAEYLGSDYIYSMKPSPTDIAVPDIDEDRIRKDLRRALEITRGCQVEIIMKDNNTIGNNPENVIKWCKIAKEESEKLFGGNV